MDSDLANLLEVMLYLIGGTIAIAVLAGWVLRRLGPRK
jgi:hypothetical protein